VDFQEEDGCHAPIKIFKDPENQQQLVSGMPSESTHTGGLHKRAYAHTHAQAALM
jgi:hypothetical protein